MVAREGRRLRVGADTAHPGAFDAHRSFGPFDAALMPIGAPDPWIHAHCTPEQAMAMAEAAGARLFVPRRHQSCRSSRSRSTNPSGAPSTRSAKSATAPGCEGSGRPSWSTRERRPGRAGAPPYFSILAVLM